MKKHLILLVLVLLALTKTSAQYSLCDVDHDGNINTTDVVEVYNTILNGGFGWADVDGSGKVTTADVVAVYNAILSGGASSSYPAKTTVTVNGVSFAMIFVQGGTFQMGATKEQSDDAYSDEKPAHQVTVSSYYIGQTEVTQQLWQAIMGQTPTADGSQWTSLRGLGDNYPAYYLSYDNCIEFVEKLNELTNLNFRLPTEAEWEFAARGGRQSYGSYKYAGGQNLKYQAWYADNSSSSTHPVATKQPNELGIYDMSGNVEEWCSDWKGSYSNAAQINPTGPETGTTRVTRGGSWFSTDRLSRVSARSGWNPEKSTDGTGLRLVFGAESVEPIETIKPDDPVEGQKTYNVNGVSFKMNLVEGGTFQMGATAEQGDEYDDDRCEFPIHKVTLSSYYIGQTEVTQELWQAVMGQTPTADGRQWSAEYGLGPKYPAYFVNYEDCQAFIQKLNQLTGENFCLPTEAEWEYAARGGNKSRGYRFAGGSIINDVAWNYYNASRKSHTVATKASNELGLFDMSGNVDEWCSDWYAYYYENETNPTGPETGDYRVTRGGGWYTENYCRVSARYCETPTVRYNSQGFRLALHTEGLMKAIEVEGVTFMMMPVEGGTFQMGATPEQEGSVMESEKPVHNVTLSNYYISQTEVTQELWYAVMGRKPTYDGEKWSATYGLGKNYPAYYVSYQDCQDFIADLNDLTNLNFRLPTEAEWEFAARGGNKSKGYNYSGSNNISDVAWYRWNTSIPREVGTKAPNELGLYDMSGSLWEWCSDWYGDYRTYDQTNPAGPASGTTRVTRGGSWKDAESYSRVAYRSGYSPTSRFNNIGFRLVIGTEPLSEPEPVENAETFTVNGVSFKMASVKGGTFQMGATAEQGEDVFSNEKPVHKVTLSDYYIGQTEVTQDLWYAVMGKSPTDDEGYNWIATYGLGDKYPAYNINYEDCQEFIQRLNQLTGKVFRMPTEAEWEFAARGGTKSKGYKHAGSDDINRVAWYKDNASNQTHEVAKKYPNELGIYDMSGNVQEWCYDWFGSYSSSDQTNPTGPTSGDSRIFRGGCFNSIKNNCRVSTRFPQSPTNRTDYIGLRLVLCPDEQPKTFTANGVSFNMVSVNGGTFWMGATTEQGEDAYSNEKPMHQVTLSDYYIGQTEVTQELWQAVMGNSPTADGDKWKTTWAYGAKYPAYYISYIDCQSFIEKLNQLTGQKFRMPTEAEWEFAARGGNERKVYKYAGSITIDDVAWYSLNCGRVHEVATKLSNELGLYDMSGNLQEWCYDWFGDYSDSAQTNPVGPDTGTERSIRGGSWSDKARNCRYSYRYRREPTYRNIDVGFRLAL